MSVPSDPITMKRLVLVKALFNQAQTHAQSTQSAVKRLTAVIEFDLAIETALKAVLYSILPTSDKQPANNFQGLIQQLDQYLPSIGIVECPAKRTIQHVHSIRNDAQHKARYPNDSEVAECRVYARDFLVEILNSVWNLDFSRVFMSDLVNDDEVRRSLARSEEQLVNGAFQQAAGSAAYGLELTIFRVSLALVGPELDGTVSRLREALARTALGITFSSYRNFREIAGRVSFNVSGNQIINSQCWSGKENVTQDEAEFVVAFAIESVLEIERRMGTLNFGMLDSWG
jgi:hypothetical protein